MVKTYKIEKNEYVYEQIIGLAKSYTRWTDGDWNYVKSQMDNIYKSEGESALFDFFNKIFYDVVKIEWEEKCQIN